MKTGHREIEIGAWWANWDKELGHSKAIPRRMDMKSNGNREIKTQQRKVRPTDRSLVSKYKKGPCTDPASYRFLAIADLHGCSWTGLPIPFTGPLSGTKLGIGLMHGTTTLLSAAFYKSILTGAGALSLFLLISFMLFHGVGGMLLSMNVTKWLV